MQKQEPLLKKFKWNTLLVLDACRYDRFKKVYQKCGLKGKLRCVDSQATWTIEWYKKHWNRKGQKIVVISAHPFLKDRNKRLFSLFYKVVYVKGLPNADISNTYKSWMNPLESLKQIKKTQKKFPNKKLLIHFIPPHLPFIGPKGKKYQEYLAKKYSSRSIYTLVENDGRRSGWEKAKKCYTESIKITLQLINKFLYQMRPPVIITADHAELIGEADGISKSAYNHGVHIKIRKIREVPWLEVKI